MSSPRDAYNRIQSHRSTWAGVGGIAAIAAGVALTLEHVGGNVLPTVLGIVGTGSLLAGVATGAAVVMDNFRYRRDKSDDDR